MRDGADVVFVDAKVFTASARSPWARALAVGEGRILCAGSNAQAERYVGKSTRVVPLDGRVVLPGFTDAHAHLMSSAGRVDDLDVSSASSLEALREAVRSRAVRTGTRRWIVGGGWDESTWSERRFPTRSDLDPVSGDRPVFLARVDRHSGVANTTALRRLRIPRGVRGVDRDRRGRPTGVLREAAYERAIRATRATVDRLVRDFPGVQARALRLGITSVHDVVDDRGMAAYRDVRSRGRLRIRVYLIASGAAPRLLSRNGRQVGFGDSWLRLGAVKLYADGSFGTRTAALLRPFQDDPRNDGYLVHRPADLERRIRRIHESGFQAAVHAIGDRAIALAEDGFSVLGDGARDRRHRIEHFELTPVELVRRARRLGLVASCQPNFAGRWGHPGGLYESRLGGRRLRKTNRFGTILRHGVPLAFGSDGMPYGPLIGIDAAVNHPNEDERISVENAVRAYTLGGAFAAFEEDSKGSLEPGKFADLVVLDGDPFRDPDRIGSMRVRAVVVGGTFATGAGAFK